MLIDFPRSEGSGTEALIARDLRKDGCSPAAGRYRVAGNAIAREPERRRRRRRRGEQQRERPDEQPIGADADRRYNRRRQRRRAAAAQ